MIDKVLDKITTADIYALESNGVAEQRTLEYKLALPGISDAEKKEFLADVSSFANAGGGDIIYGIEEARTTDGKKTGLPKRPFGLGTINAPDEIRLRLSQLIRDGIAPRIPGVDTRVIEGFDNGAVLILRVPQSFAAPHMMTFKSESRFYSRTSNGKQPLDVHEIRAAFAASETVSERVEQFRLGRIGKIVAGETPVVIGPEAKAVLHVVPLQSLDRRAPIDVAAEGEKRKQDLAGLHPDFDSWRFCLEGLITYSLPRKDFPERRYTPYTLLFRNGAIETILSGLLQVDATYSHIQVVPSPALEEEMQRTVGSFMALQVALGLSPPFAILLTFGGVRNARMARHFLRNTEYDSRWFDRDIVSFPAILIEDPGVAMGISLRPLFDSVWQAAGYSRCPHYDVDGKWKREGSGL